jgi:hypothetical protein
VNRREKIYVLIILFLFLHFYFHSFWDKKVGDGHLGSAELGFVPGGGFLASQG